MAFCVGIAGRTGSGKTTLAEGLMKQLAEQAVLLSYDWYYRDQSQLSPAEREHTNYDHPDALETDLLIHHLRQLADGNPVEVPVYDFALHTRSADTQWIEGKPVIIVEGIQTFVPDALRDLFHLKVFIDTPPEVCLQWRIARDVIERGRDREEVASRFLENAEPMFQQFVEPTKHDADIVLSGTGDVATAVADVMRAIEAGIR